MQVEASLKIRLETCFVSMFASFIQERLMIRAMHIFRATTKILQDPLKVLLIQGITVVNIVKNNQLVGLGSQT